jgi:type VI secretion system protein ImpL
MKAVRLLHWLAAAVRRNGIALSLAYVLLAAWGLGVAIAAYQLGNWREELSRTLLQLNADARFRARVPNRDAVDPEWYRRKALALLSATERLQHDAAWTLFIPGSWRAFDNIEEQVQARVDREFGDIVVETVRRELYARASKVTGVPLAHATGDLQAGADCESPVPQSPERRLSAAPEDLAEFVAISDYVAAVERLDSAVQSFLSLHYSGGDPDQLRKLVAYTLDKELPGSLAQSVRMFHGGEEVNLQPALMQSRLQWATRCALAKAMTALHTRLLNTNDLFALEQSLVEHSAGLFDASARAAAFDRTLERYRTVHALLEDQNALLAKGGNDWMREGTLKLGPRYQDVLRRIERTRLLGPEVVQQLQNQSGAAFAEFRRQFELAFGGRGEPGVVWLEDEKRFGLSSEREGLRTGLGSLLKTSFMTPDANRATPAAHDNVALAKVLEEAKALADERTRALDEIVPSFPEAARPVVQRVIDARVSDLVYQRGLRALKSAFGGDPKSPLDPTAFKRQREQAVALHAILKDSGGSALGDRLVATLDAELLRRLAVLQHDWQQQSWVQGKADDFGWWQGEPLSLAQSLGATEAAGAPPTLTRTASRIEVLVQQAKGLLALGGPSLAADAGAGRWLRLQSELERYNTHAADSSLVRLERYVAATGPDLRKENCAERLAAAAPASSADDDISQRHLQLHQALLRRCAELRAPMAVPAAAPASTPAPATVLAQ